MADQMVRVAVLIDLPDAVPNQATERLALFVQDPDGGPLVPFFEAMSDLTVDLSNTVSALTDRVTALEEAATP